MKDAEVILVYKNYEWGGREYEIWTLEHPEGVECVFTDSKCACGRLDLGIVESPILSTRHWEIEDE